MSQTTQPSGELVHYGIKGMKWGVRKAKASDAPNKRYSKSNRELDRSTFGKGGVKRINRRMNAGKTHKQAAGRELGRSIAISVALAGAAAAPQILAIHGKDPIIRTAKRAERKRGEARARDILAESRGLRATPGYSKQRRNGVYNISSL